MCVYEIYINIKLGILRDLICGTHVCAKGWGDDAFDFLYPFIIILLLLLLMEAQKEEEEDDDDEWCDEIVIIDDYRVCILLS